MRAAQEKPDLCIEIAGILAELLTREGHDTADAERIALETAETLRQTMGGSLIYVTKEPRFKMSQRDLQIFHEYNGRNINELAIAHNLSYRAIYKILVRVRAEIKNQTQPDLFGSEAHAAAKPPRQKLCPRAKSQVPADK